MTYLRKAWNWYSPLTRGLVLFLLTNIALNLFIWKFGGAYKATVLSYTRAFLNMVAGPDSWAPMRFAFDYLDSPRLQPLYSSLMIADRV